MLAKPNLHTRTLLVRQGGKNLKFFTPANLELYADDFTTYDNFACLEHSCRISNPQIKFYRKKSQSV